MSCASAELPRKKFLRPPRICSATSARSCATRPQPQADPPKARPAKAAPWTRTSLRGTESDCTLVDPTRGREDPTRGRDDPTRGREDPTRGREGPASGRRALLTRLVSRCDGRGAYDQCGGFCDR